VSSSPVPRVFIVDDEHVIASTLAAILRMHGYSATFFTSPVEALATSRSGVPDLLISDVAMPGISGIDLATQMGFPSSAPSAVFRYPTRVRLLGTDRKSTASSRGDSDLQTGV
jgi:FixJ family two-component response regulator